MKNQSLVAAALLSIFFLCPIAHADGWQLWPFGKSSTSQTPESSRRSAAQSDAASKRKSSFSLWSKPAPDLRSSRATAARPASRNQPSTLAKITNAPKAMWQRTTSALSPKPKSTQAKSTPPQSKRMRDFSVWPTSWFKPIEDESEGPRTVTEWMKQPRLDP